MKIKKFYIYWADLNPRIGTEPGKKRPVVVIQTNLLNNTHPSTLVCPITTQVIEDVSILRVHLSENETSLKKNSDILVDQIRSIDNRRFIHEIGRICTHHERKLLENLTVLLFE
jgi:mRNA interferase MazF